MIYSENLTNKELLKNAMPLVSLTRMQWNIILAYAERLENSKSNPELQSVLEVLISNQSKLEIMEQYSYYYYDELDNKVFNESVDLLSLY